jgi:hypothetical protein
MSGHRARGAATCRHPNRVIDGRAVLPATAVLTDEGLAQQKAKLLDV